MQEGWNSQRETMPNKSCKISLHMSFRDKRSLRLKKKKNQEKKCFIRKPPRAILYIMKYYIVSGTALAYITFFQVSPVPHGHAGTKAQRGHFMFTRKVKLLCLILETLCVIHHNKTAFKNIHTLLEEKM